MLKVGPKLTGERDAEGWTPCPFCNLRVLAYDNSETVFHPLDSECVLAGRGFQPSERDKWNRRGYMEEVSRAESVARAIANAMNVDPDMFIGMHGRYKWEKQWHPIETAPKDGTPLLLYARAKTATAPIVLVGWAGPATGDWLECCFSPNNQVGIVPTHWRPLPPAPL